MGSQFLSLMENYNRPWEKETYLQHNLNIIRKKPIPRAVPEVNLKIEVPVEINPLGFLLHPFQLNI